MIKIAKVVSSVSHVDYIGRVIDELDAENAPGPDDYGFGQFVVMPVQLGHEVIGIIYNSQLANPEYGSLGPRLSSAAELAVLSPDILREQGVLLGLLLLGWRDGETGACQHGVPRRVVPVNQDVYQFPADQVSAFHRDGSGQIQMQYYSQILSQAGQFGVPLLESILAQLENEFPAAERARLDVLKQALAWQRTVGGMRL